MQNEGPARTEQINSAGMTPGGANALGAGDKERGIFSTGEEAHTAETDEVMTGGSSQNMGEQALRMSELLTNLNERETQAVSVSGEINRSIEEITDKAEQMPGETQADLSNVADAEGNDINLASGGATEMLNDSIKDGNFMDKSAAKEAREMISSHRKDPYELNNMIHAFKVKYWRKLWGRIFGNNNDTDLEGINKTEEDNLAVGGVN